MLAPAAWRNADEFVISALGDLKPGQRGLVFVLDPDAVLSLPQHGEATIQDSSGDNWRLFAYQGNDMALRARVRFGAPTVVWVRPAPLAGPDSIDLTTLADFVARADAFIDASVPGMLSSLLNDVPLPEQTADWAPGARRDPAGFARALRRVLAFRGVPVTRRHILAAALCQSSRYVQPELAWMGDTNLPGLIVSYAHVVAADREGAVRVVAAQSFHHAASLLVLGGNLTVGARELAGQPADTLVDFLYLLAAMRRLNIPDPQPKLANAGLLAPDVGALFGQLPALTAVLGEAADELNARPAALRAIAADAEQRLSKERLHQLGGVVTSHAARWAGEPTAGVRLALLAALSDELLEGTVEFPSGAFSNDPVGQPRLVRAAEALQRLLATIASYSTRLATGVESAASADLDALVDGYTTGVANVELDMIEARRDLQVTAGALGPHEKLAARIVALAAAAEEAVAAYDAQLEHILHVTPDAILSSSRAVHRFLPAHLVPQIEVNPNLRVWLLVFDALRWDLWERVLRPEFEAAGWACYAEAGLALLPSETYFSRRSLLGGASPVTWAGSSGATEESLARRFLQAHFPDASDIVFRLKAQQGNDYDLGPPPAGKANVWVFQTPDQQVHHAGDSLRDIAEQFRTYLQANVIPELQAEIGSDDLVFVATDHGFTRISGENTHTVSLPRERVDYRYLTLADSDDPAGIPGVDVVYPGLGRYRVATGNFAFVAIGGSAPVSGFRHGGATLRELVVPVVELHRPVTKATGFSLELSGPAHADEDAEMAYVVHLSNTTGETVRGQFVFETNLGLVMKTPLQMVDGATSPRHLAVKAQEGLQWVRARVTVGAATLDSRNQTVTINLKKGIRLKGLEALDGF